MNQDLQGLNNLLKHKLEVLNDKRITADNGIFFLRLGAIATGLIAILALFSKYRTKEE